MVAMIDKLGMIGVSDPVETLDYSDLVLLSTALRMMRMGDTPPADQDGAFALQDRMNREMARRMAMRQGAGSNGDNG